MPRAQAKKWTVADYDRAAQAYYRRLPLEHFMEAIPQATQRKITVESLDLLARQRTDVQVFNELLIQYRRHGRIRRVVPDNMVHLSRQPLATDSSYNLELEENVTPFIVMEYVSASNYNKDYKDVYEKYEQELRVPYYLLYWPDKLDLRLHRHNGTSYDRVAPNDAGRYDIPELQLELGIVDGWVRYWYRGEMLLLPGELQNQLDQETHRADQETHRADQAEAELARLREQLAQLQNGKNKGGHSSKEK